MRAWPNPLDGVQTGTDRPWSGFSIAAGVRCAVV